MSNEPTQYTQSKVPDVSEPFHDIVNAARTYEFQKIKVDAAANEVAIAEKQLAVKKDDLSFKQKELEAIATRIKNASKKL